MQSLMRKRTINEIIAKRKTQRQQKDPNRSQFRTLGTSIQVEIGNQFRMDVFLKKSSYNSQDKFLLLRHLEKKYRMRFDPAFSNLTIQWLNVREKQIIDKHFDPQRKSYFLLKGKIAICQRVHHDPLRQTSASESEGRSVRRYQQVASLQPQKGIGALFSTESYQKAILLCENCLILMMEHTVEQLQLVQRDCVMTTDERETFIKNFPLFRKLDNINKHYTPFFRVKKCNKGDTIYQIDAEALCLYLIAEGEVEFQSRVPHQQQNKQEEAISRLILRNCWQNYMLVTTEIVGKGNYFGEEEILNETPRQQNAKCLSLTCVLLEVPLQKLHKLLFYNEFREALENSALFKSQERKRKIGNFLTHRGPNQGEGTSERAQQSIAFEQFNQAIFQSCSERTSGPKRLSLRGHRTKILHGSALKLNPHSRARQESFSMLQVNAEMYHSSAKRFRATSVDEKKRRKKQEKGKGQGREGKVQGREGRSLKQIWQVLKLENVIQQEERVGIENTEGKAYFNAHMRLQRHIRDVKSYRPKTISSNCRVKTQFVEYLHRIV